MIVGNGDFINLSSDESTEFMYRNMLNNSTIRDVYKAANVPEGIYISGVEFDESTNTFTFTFSNGTKFTAKVNSNGDVDLSDYVKKDEVDSRIESVIGSAPEALDTLQELSKALGDDPNFATTVTEMISEVEKKTEEIKSSIPSIDGLATKEEVKQVQESIPSLDGYITNEELESKGYLTEHQDISNLVSKDELAESVSDSVKYKEFTYTNSENETSTRKTIQLDNYDTISGVTTNGVGVNLAMVSKWDVADFGSTSIHMNLNSKDGKVTINDNEEIAVKSDIPSIDGLAQTSYVVLQKDQAIETSKSYTDEVAEGIRSSIPSIEGLASEEWVESKGYLTEHQDISNLSTKQEASKIKSDLDEEVEARGLADTKIQEDLQYEAATARTAEKANSDAISNEILRATSKENEIELSLDRTLKYSTSVYEGREKKVTTLDNDQLINALTNKEELEDKVNVSKNTVSLIQLNRWNVVDVGSPYTLTNINTPNGVRPTVQEASQSGPEANKIAYLSDIPSVDGLATESYVTNATSNNAVISMLTNRLSQLEDQISDLKKTDTELISAEAGQAVTIADSTKDAIISGSIDTTSTISAKSVTLKGIDITNNARLSLSTINSGDVEVKSASISGDFPKSNGGNAVVKINDAGYVTIKDAVINANLYNCIEVGLNKDSILPSGVLIENCRFEGTFSNNAILIFGTADSAVININNCYFENVSNCIRISNKTNVKCTVNISNCTCDHWDTTPEWAGMIICQDYTSKTAENCVSNNLFSNSKITINISNFTKPDGTKIINPSEMSDICGSNDSNQILYVWNEPEGSVPYGDGSRYPTVNIL